MLLISLRHSCLILKEHPWHLLKRLMNTFSLILFNLPKLIHHVFVNLCPQVLETLGSLTPNTSISLRGRCTTITRIDLLLLTRRQFWSIFQFLVYFGVELTFSYRKCSLLNVKTEGTIQPRKEWYCAQQLLAPPPPLWHRLAQQQDHAHHNMLAATEKHILLTDWNILKLCSTTILEVIIVQKVHDALQLAGCTHAFFGIVGS